MIKKKKKSRKLSPNERYYRNCRDKVEGRLSESRAQLDAANTRIRRLLVHLSETFHVLNDYWKVLDILALRDDSDLQKMAYDVLNKHAKWKQYQFDQRGKI